MAKSKKSKKNSRNSQKNLTPAVPQANISESYVEGEALGWRHVIIASLIAGLGMLVLPQIPDLICSKPPQEPLLLTEEVCNNSLSYTALLESLEDITVPPSPKGVTKAEADLLFYALVRQFQKLVTALPDRTTCLKMSTAMIEGKLIVDFFRRDQDETFAAFGERHGRALIAINPVALGSLRGNEEKIVQSLIALQKFSDYYEFFAYNPETTGRILKTLKFNSQGDCDFFIDLRTMEVAGLCDILQKIPYTPHGEEKNKVACGIVQNSMMAFLVDKEIYARSDCEFTFARMHPPDF